MLSVEQEAWVNHLSDQDRISIYPYDPGVPEIFDEIKMKIKSVLPEVDVEHHGASSLRISGQDEIDVYIPVEENKFRETVGSVAKFFGEPASFYDLVRARFPFKMRNKRADIMVVNKEAKSWLESIVFERYLTANAQALKEYEKLKELGNGSSTRNYYRAKIEFINSTLERAK
jgi:GrpB-like predicted nucleotidyltransferase (UPF0157 family)